MDCLGKGSKHLGLHLYTKVSGRLAMNFISCNRRHYQLCLPHLIAPPAPCLTNHTGLSILNVAARSLTLNDQVSISMSDNVPNNDRTVDVRYFECWAIRTFAISNKISSLQSFPSETIIVCAA